MSIEAGNIDLVYTIKGRCRVCYTCVRECPVKAIRILNGQAEIIQERCIACGNCVRVCSQSAKAFRNTKEQLHQTLQSDKGLIACIAPSFPAEFSEIKDYRNLVGMFRKAGFDKVVEVSFGADVVARQYELAHEKEPDKSFISSDCPAIVYYVKQYYPELTGNLMPVVSPMVAIARIVREKYGKDRKVVFVGPCIAKKIESDELNIAISFKEIREFFQEKGIHEDPALASDFDPPYSARGAVFPISRGMLQTMKKCENISGSQIIVTQGSRNFKEVIREFASGNLDEKHIELLCCEGCISGPGMSQPGSRFVKRALVNKYVSEKMKNLDEDQWNKNMHDFKNLDYSCSFTPLDRRYKTPAEDEISKTLVSIGKQKPEDHLNCGACGYETCREHAIAIVQGLAEDEMCLPNSIEKLHSMISSLNVSNDKLANAQQALKQSEKLAHMGQLSAGIAHELNNPLGVITMYANILKEEANSSDPLFHDLELIVEQTERCKNIVSGLLNFARKNQVYPQRTHIVEFCEHSLTSLIIPPNIRAKVQSAIENPWVFIDPTQMMQVLTNLGKNAIEAMPDGGELTITLSESSGFIAIELIDTGSGISKENMEKIFTPFFTTKPIGKGTGLGLPLVYGIVKMHKGKITVQSSTGEDGKASGTCFKITLPKNV